MAPAILRCIPQTNILLCSSSLRLSSSSSDGSGGARMQEGSLSLIQMAKSFAAAIDRVSLPVFLSQDHASSPTSNSCALRRGFTFLSLLCFPSRTSACSRSISLAKSLISKQFSSYLIQGGANSFIPLVFHTHKRRSLSASIHRVWISKLSCCQHLLPASRLAVYQAPQQITNHLHVSQPFVGGATEAQAGSLLHNVLQK